MNTGIINIVFGDFYSRDATVDDIVFPDFEQFSEGIDGEMNRTVYEYDSLGGHPYGFEGKIKQMGNGKWIANGIIKTDAGVVRSYVTTREHNNIEDTYNELKNTTIQKMERLIKQA